MGKLKRLPTHSALRHPGDLPPPTACLTPLDHTDSLSFWALLLPPLYPSCQAGSLPAFCHSLPLPVSQAARVTRLPTKRGATWSCSAGCLALQQGTLRLWNLSSVLLNPAGTQISSHGKSTVFSPHHEKSQLQHSSAHLADMHLSCFTCFWNTGEVFIQTQKWCSNSHAPGTWHWQSLLCASLQSAYEHPASAGKMYRVSASCQRDLTLEEELSRHWPLWSETALCWHPWSLPFTVPWLRWIPEKQLFWVFCFCVHANCAGQSSLI